VVIELCCTCYVAHGYIDLLCRGGGYVDGVTSWWMILQNRGDLLVGKIIKL